MQERITADGTLLNGSVVGISQTMVRAEVPVLSGLSTVYKWQYDLGQGDSRRWVDVPDTMVHMTTITVLRGNTTVTVRYRTETETALGNLNADITMAVTTLVLTGEVTGLAGAVIEIGNERMYVESSQASGANTELTVRRGFGETTAAAHAANDAVRRVTASNWRVVGTGWTIAHPLAPSQVRNIVLSINTEGIPRVRFDEPLDSPLPIHRYAVAIYTGTSFVQALGTQGFANPDLTRDRVGETVYLPGEYYAEVRAVSVLPTDDPNTGGDDLAGDWAVSNGVNYDGQSLVSAYNRGSSTPANFSAVLAVRGTVTDESGNYRLPLRLTIANGVAPYTIAYRVAPAPEGGATDPFDDGRSSDGSEDATFHWLEHGEKLIVATVTDANGVSRVAITPIHLKSSLRGRAGTLRSSLTAPRRDWRSPLPV